MEDALAHSLTNLERDELAPVLILVLMEDALVPKSRKGQRFRLPEVLILVLMEDALVRSAATNRPWANKPTRNRFIHAFR